MPAMNRKAASLGARSTKASSPSGAGRTRVGVDHHPFDLARDLPRGAEIPAHRAIMRFAVGAVPRQDPQQPERITHPLSRRRSAARPGSPTSPERPTSPPPVNNRRPLSCVEMYGSGDLYGPGDTACSTGARTSADNPGP